MLFCLTAATALGCGSNAAGPTDDTDFVSCADETRATPYAPGMSVTSLNGAFVVKLLNNVFVVNGKALSEAPAKGDDTWTLEVDDATTGAPVDGVTMTVNPRMPDQRHGTTPVGVTAAGGGTYTLDPVNLFMAGYWEVTIGLGAATDAADSAVFRICVPG
jgi:hypothetical protein